jgi:hypothetical protein
MKLRLQNITAKCSDIRKGKEMLPQLWRAFVCEQVQVFQGMSYQEEFWRRCEMQFFFSSAHIKSFLKNIKSIFGSAYVV